MNKYKAWRNYMPVLQNIKFPAEFARIEPEENRRAAEKNHARLLDTMASIERTNQSVIQLCARAIGVPQQKDPSSIIWHGIVEYANAELGQLTGIAKAFSVFQGFSVLCLRRLGDPLFGNANITDVSFEDLEKQGEHANTPFDKLFDLCCHRLIELHPGFCEMLKWLVDPNACHASQKNRAVGFLVEHGGEGAIQFDLDANTYFDESGNDGAPFYYWKTARRYKSILSPVTKYIVDRIEQYQSDDKKLRLSRTEAIPLIICKRMACRRFSVLQRMTKDFCSASCRTLHRQTASPEQHAAYQRRYRQIYKKPS
jgi:hypothetical protein